MTVVHSASAPELDIGLRHLFAFVAVADAGSVAAASERLFRATSAVARAITNLESDFGVRLFDRRARGMLVNAYGRAVLVRAHRVRDELAALAKVLPASGAQRAESGFQIVLSALPNGRRLAAVARLADLHNMHAVARELHVTQAAISTAVKELEDRLQVQLFIRSPKGLVATDAGEIVALHFRRCLAELRHVMPDLAAMEGVVRGTVRVGALPLGRTRILPSSIAAAVDRCPGLRVVTVESPYDVLAAHLRSGDIDFVFGALRAERDAGGLCQDALFDDCISIIARAGHPLTTRSALTLQDLRDARWVLWRADTPARETLERVFREGDESVPQPSVETGDLALLRGILLQSDMLTAISAQQLHYEIAWGHAKVLPIGLAETRRSIGIAQRQGALPSPGARVLLDEIGTQVRRMIDGGELLAVA